MTLTTTAGISSGLRYPVAHPDGRPAATAADFIGETAFLIRHADQSMLIEGVGHSDTCGTGVYFHQKDPTHDGRDVRIWHLRSLPDGQLIAEHVAAI